MCKGTKNVRVSQNEGPMRAKCYFLWHIMVLNFLVCLVWALWGLVWSCNSCCFLRPSAYVALCGLISLFMALYGLLWSFMAKDRLFSWSQIQIHLVLLKRRCGQGQATFRVFWGISGNRESVGMESQIISKLSGSRVHFLRFQI